MLKDIDHKLTQLATFSSDERVKIMSGCLISTEGKFINQQSKELTLFINSLHMMVKVDLSKTSVSA